MTESEQKQVFESWISQHKGLIFKIVRAYALTPMDREDLFQDVVIQLWKSIPSFRGEAAASTWMYRIALNTAIKWTSKEQKFNQTESLDDVQPVLHLSDVQVNERLEWLYEEICRLDAIDRSLALLLLDGFSYKDMAVILGITESNVGVKINRIKKQLIERSKKIAL